jgi:hypothetical protein
MMMPTEAEMPDISAAFDYGDAVAWAFIAAVLVFNFEVRRMRAGSAAAAALAVFSALVVGAALMPLT